MGITLRMAWLNLWRQPRRTWLTTGAMVFCNVILVFLISLQLGMYRLMIDNSLRALTGHLQVQVEGYLDDEKIRQSIPEVERLAEALREELQLDTVAARGAAFALAASESRSFGIKILGVEPEYEVRASALPGQLSHGRYLESLSAAEIVIGSVLARNLQVEVGGELTLLGSGRDGSFAAAVVNVVGVFKSGIAEIDRGVAEVPLHFFQDTFSMGDAGHSILILAPDLFQVASLKTRANLRLPPGQELVVRDWDALMPGLKQAIQADFVSAWFMYGVLIVLVAFSVLNTQLMSVLERTREFGTALALGLTPGRLGRLVLLESLFMGVIGLVLGVTLGVVILLWLGHTGFSFPGMAEMTAKFNVPSRIYPQISAIGLFLGPGIVLLSTVVASIYPALRLRRLEPVEAMRSA
jgi:putative ABC transport system permease protein